MLHGIEFEGIVLVNDGSVVPDNPVLGIGGCWKCHELLIGGIYRTVGVQQYWKGQPRLFDELQYMVTGFMRSDAPYDDAVVFIFPPDAVFDVRDLGRTDRSPSGEIDQDNRTSTIVTESVQHAVQIFEFEIRRFRTESRQVIGGSVLDLNSNLIAVGI